MSNLIDYTQTEPFKSALKRWRADYGTPITHEGIATAQALNGALINRQVSPGVEMGWVAMMLRPEGGLLAHFKSAFKCGPAFNKSRDLIDAGYVTFSVKGVTSLSRRTPNQLVLTARGRQVVERAAKAAAKAAGAVEPTTPKAPRKRPSKVTEPVSTPVEATVADSPVEAISG